MADFIRDGSGQGYLAKVNANNRLYTNSVTVPEEQEATKLGNSYNINTGIVTLTNATETPLIYIKNREVRDLHVLGIVAGFGTSTGGDSTEPIRVTVIRNPTTGTIISGATAVAVNSNRNFSSPKTLTADVYVGATGNTMTDGETHLIAFQPQLGRLFLDIDEILGRSASLGVKIKPQSGNTSLDCYVSLILHLEDDKA